MTRPQGYSTASPARAGQAPYVSCCQMTADLAPAGAAGRQKSPSRDCHTRQQAISIGIEPSNLPPSPLTAGLTLAVASLRWIRD